MADAGFGLAPALLVLGNAGRFLQEDAQFVGFGLDHPRNHALFDNGIAARPQSGAQEDVGDVPAAAARAVEEVAGLAIAADQPLDRDFAVAGPRTAQAALAVVEHQLDAGLSDRFATGRAVEDHVAHALAAQAAGRAFPHHPAHRVDDVGLAATVGTDDAQQVAGQMQHGGVHERLEPRQLDLA